MGWIKVWSGRIIVCSGWIIVCWGWIIGWSSWIGFRLIVTCIGNDDDILSDDDDCELIGNFCNDGLLEPWGCRRIVRVGRVRGLCRWWWWLWPVVGYESTSEFKPDTYFILRSILSGLI
jgi:hypothetical protein